MSNGKIEELQKENQELKEKLAQYESDPSAQFYKVLVEAIKHIELEVQNKTLNFEKDLFADSILTLADKSSKVFDGLDRGRESFLNTGERPSKKSAKSTTGIV